jgi:kynurenine formamidase
MMRLLSASVLVALLVSAACAAEPGANDAIVIRTAGIIDLTHTLNARTAFWPGPRNRGFHWEPFATLEADQVFEGRFTVDEHTGTHIDAPNHFVAGQSSLDAIPVEQFFVPAIVVDVRERVASNPDYLLSVQDLEAWERTHGQIIPRAVVFMYTGWDARWGDFERYKNADARGVLHFPGFSEATASWLLDRRDITGLGIDALSVDYGMSTDFGVHRVTHGRGKYNLENVANLGRVPASGALLLVAPLKIEGGSGSPVRLFAAVPPQDR